MRSSWDCLLYLGVLGVVASGHKMLDDCLASDRKYKMNVVLLEDNTYEWSRPFVQRAVEHAIEKDRQKNVDNGTVHRKPQTNWFPVADKTA